MSSRTKTTWCGPRAFAVALLMALSGPSGSSAAEHPCAESLGQAVDNHRIGHFTRTLELLEGCTGSDVPREVRISALHLLAKSALALDDLELASALVDRLLAAEPRFEGAFDDPPRFLRLLEAGRARLAAGQVFSVSKSRESRLAAPATVEVVTAEEIARRGYLDLEEVLHDLPGFDISRTRGLAYSHVYMRGYRSIETNRILFLVDGVEQNNLFSNIVYLSRQFPLSNVQAVEVIYGPASTMYGANAFAGVINVVTKEPWELVDPDRPITAQGHLTAGSWDTRSADVTVAGHSRTGSVAWSLTGRVYRSDEPDLSGYDDWDYDPAFYDGVDYGSLASLSVRGAEEAQAFLAAHPDAQGSPLVRITTDAHGTATGVGLTPEGVQRARELDRGALGVDLGGEPVGFSNVTEDWALQGKLVLSNLTLGFETWTRDEGSAPWLTDQVTVGSRNGMRWIPRQSLLFARYSRPFRNNLWLHLVGSYRNHELEDGSAVVLVDNYAQGGLGLGDLLEDRPAVWNRSFNYLSNSQVRGEARVVYEVDQETSLVAGLEVRQSSIQGDNVVSDRPNPQETGMPASEIPGGNQFSIRDLGLYAQVAHQVLEDLKLVVGGRADNNRIRNTAGYGTVLTPRVALVATPGDLVLKAVYAEAFEDPPNFQKFATVPGFRELPNPDLAPERVRSMELSVGIEPTPSSTLTLAAYEARYTNLVEQVEVACDDCSTPTTGQFRNVGSLQVRGLQLSGTLALKGMDLFANYTYTDPKDPDLDLRVGDIASHRLNLGLYTSLTSQVFLDLRGNYVGVRRTGPGTTVGGNPLGDVPASFVAHATLTYRDLLPGVGLQLIVKNLFDRDYSDPGIRAADGSFFAARIPQPGRAIFLRLLIPRP